MIISNLVALWTEILTPLGSAIGVEVSPSRADALVLTECASFATYSLIMSWMYNSYSFVDQLWSLTPIAYVVTWLAHDRSNVRLRVMCGMTLIWGVRLTYNFARKGGYSGEEDYRWAVLRENKILKNPVVWQLFNVSFISFYQHALLMLIALPAGAAARSKEAFDLRGVDGAAVALWTIAFVIEVVADEQQWRFQRSKRGKARKVKRWRDDYKRGFLTHGLFSLSRHPNFWAEQTLWVAFSWFAAASSKTKELFTPWITGAVLLILLFQGSTAFTESITAKKYPEYAAYQQCTSRLLPFPRRRSLPPPKDQ